MKFTKAGALSLACLIASGHAAASDLSGEWDDGPSGLYYMTVYQVAARTLERRTYFFEDDRWVQDPQGYVGDLDWSSFDPAAAGTWSLDGNRLTMTLATGPADTEEVAPDAKGCFQFISGMWCPAPTFASGALSGTYSGGSDYNTFAVASDIRFSPDGTYTALHAASYNNPDGGDAGKTGANDTVHGTYRIVDMGLVLTEDNGKVSGGNAFPFGDNVATDTPEYIYFQGIMMKRSGD